MSPDAAKPSNPLPEQRRIAELESRIRSLEQELRAVYASRSWRITHPLRSVVSATAGRIRHALAFFGGTEETRPTDHTGAEAPHTLAAPPVEASRSGELTPPTSTNRVTHAQLVFHLPTDEKHLGKEARKIYRKIKDALSETCE